MVTINNNRIELTHADALQLMNQLTQMLMSSEGGQYAARGSIMASVVAADGSSKIEAIHLSMPMGV